MAQIKAFFFMFCVCSLTADACRAVGVPHRLIPPYGYTVFWHFFYNRLEPLKYTTTGHHDSLWFYWYDVFDHNSLIPGPASVRCPGASHGPVCSRILPVCQHRSERHPLGAPTSAINQTLPVATVDVSYVLLIRTQPNNMNHSA